MKKRLLLLLALLCAGATAASPSLLAQDTGGPVVVLKNGAVLRGKGTNLGEKVSVELADGGMIKIPKTQVELIADSIDDAYLKRRDRLIPENVISQINLASWCIDQNMFAEAQLHLRAARKIDPSHPGITRLERKLRERQREASKPNEEELPEPETPLQTPPVEEMRRQLKAKLEAARRDTRGQLADLSPAVRHKFTREVQPLLLSSCGASKCHGPTSTAEFRLVRSSTNTESQGLLNRRNLQSVLSRIRVDAPEESPLLENAVQAHAPRMKAPPLDIQSAEFSALIAWVLEVTEEIKAIPEEQAALTPNFMPPSIGPGLSPDEFEEDDEQIADGKSSRGEAKVAKRDPRSGKPRPAEEKEKAPQRGSLPDPEEFNRRYFPDAPKQP